MNVNLISPTTNGNRYTVRFKENINVPQNSQVYLNFCSLSRESEVILTEDQTIEIDIREDTNELPQILPQQVGGTPNNPFEGMNATHTKIPKGQYTYSKLLTTISDQLLAQIINTDATHGAVLSYRPLRAEDFISPNGVIPNDTDFSMGLIWDEEQTEGALNMNYTTLSTTHGRNGTNVNPTSGDAENGTYIKSNATDQSASGYKNFDNYGLSNESYFHYGTNDDGTPLIHQNVAEFKTFETIDELRASENCLVIGLYSASYANGLQGTDGAPAPDNDPNTRTRGTGATNTGSNYVNPKQIPAVYAEDTQNRKFLGNFIQIVLDYRVATTGRFSVQALRRGNSAGTGEQIQNWDSQNNQPFNMINRGDYIQNIAGKLDITNDDHIHLGFQTYYDKTSSSSYNHRVGKRLYFRVINMAKADVSKSIEQQVENIVVYDSKKHNLYFNDKFFVSNIVSPNIGTADVKNNKLRSQIPFNVCCSSLVQNTGFTDIKIPTLDNTDFTTNPESIITRYRLNASEELGQYLGFSKFKLEGGIKKPYYTDWLYPNHYNPLNSNLVHLKTLDLEWRNESYSILVNNLPIKNFKNTESTRDGGFSKAIISNIPTPFSQSTDFVSQEQHLTSATYTPNYQIISNLYNQEFTTNKFDVEIRRLKDDLPATEILKSIVNFTIVPPPDFNKNINSN